MYVCYKSVIKPRQVKYSIIVNVIIAPMGEDSIIKDTPVNADVTIKNEVSKVIKLNELVNITL